jgi:hypothetical protein
MLAGTPARMLARYGRPMTLRRRTGSTTSFTEAAANGVLHQFSPEELSGDILHGDARIILDAAPVIAADLDPPRKGDHVVADGRTWQVLGAMVGIVRESPCAYELHVRGG